MTSPESARILLPLIQPDQLCSPTEEITGVVLALKAEDASPMLQWIVQNMYDTERRLDREGDDAPDQLHDNMTTLTIAAQAATSAASAALIYRDTFHFIFLEKDTAIDMVWMLSRQQDTPIGANLYREVVLQVDNAFTRNNEFANIPES